MLKAFKKLWNDERGNALLLGAAALPLLIGSAGLATDTIQWSLWKRQLQRTADSAAIAGVYARIATANVDAAVTSDITQNNKTQIALLTPPVITQPTVAQGASAVAVTLQIQQKLAFSSLFMSSPPIIEASATAAAIPTGEYCAQAQIDTNATGISAGGNVNVNLGCGMITNSTSIEAAVAFGSSTVRADPVAAVGGLDKTDNWAAGTTLLPFTLAQPDPFADKNPPTIPSPCNGKIDDHPHDVTSFSPGCYSSINVQGTANLALGTYIITGDMKVNSGAEMNCTGCTFVMTNPTPSDTGTVDINGNAKLNLSAPDAGTYQGILFYSDRGADPTDVNKINGGANSSFNGAMYFPHQKIEFTGDSSVTFQCLKLVSWQLTFLGNANIQNNCPPGTYGDRFKGRHVRLVA